MFLCNSVKCFEVNFFCQAFVQVKKKETLIAAGSPESEMVQWKKVGYLPSTCIFTKV